MFRQAFKFASHFLKAQNRYGVHSPFVYEFVTQVLPKKPNPLTAQLSSLKKELKQKNQTLSIEDFGAGYGGKQKPEIQKSMIQVLRSSARGRREGELLYRLVDRYQPRQLLELGTNLGFSAAWQAAAMPDQARFITVEGASQLHELAGQNLSRLFAGKVELLCAEFSDALHNQIDWTHFRPDHVLIDGNHRYEATLQYFHFLLKNCQDGCLFIFDDIYWSKGMERAWKEIIAHSEVSVSIDLFFLGLCWVRKDQAKQHFAFRF